MLVICDIIGVNLKMDPTKYHKRNSFRSKMFQCEQTDVIDLKYFSNTSMTQWIPGVYTFIIQSFLSARLHNYFAILHTSLYYLISHLWNVIICLYTISRFFVRK